MAAVGGSYPAAAPDLLPADEATTRGRGGLAPQQSCILWTHAVSDGWEASSIVYCGRCHFVGHTAAATSDVRGIAFGAHRGIPGWIGVHSWGAPTP